MGIGNIGWSEFLIVALFVLVFFGPRRLPEIANAIGRSLREFRKALNEVRDEISHASRMPETGSRPGAADTRDAAYPTMGPIAPGAGAEAEADEEGQPGSTGGEGRPEAPDATDTGSTDADTRDPDQREG